MKKAHIIRTIFVIWIITTVVFGQQHTENKADQVLRGSGRVNASTLGMEIDIPLGAYSGRGINVPINLSYSSKVWRAEYTGSQPLINNPNECVSINIPKYAENSASGWTTSMASPYIEYTGWDNIFDSSGNPDSSDCIFGQPETNENAVIRRINVHLPSGETHELRIDDTPYRYSVNTSPPSKDGIYYAADGSNIKYIEDSSNGIYKLQMPDGSFYSFKMATQPYNQLIVRKAEKFTDRNGNFTIYDEANNSWTDTLGRTLAIPLGLTAPTMPNIQTYTMPGMTGSYKFYWKKLKDTTAAESGLNVFNQQLEYMAARSSASPTEPPRTSGFLFGSTGTARLHDGGAGVFNPIVLTEIELPTGQKYKFRYNIYGTIEKIQYPTGGEELFQYGVVKPLAPSFQENISDQMNFGVINRKVYEQTGQGLPYKWTYSVEYVESLSYKVTLNNPDGTRTERFLHRGNPVCAGCSGNPGTFGYDNALAGMAYEEQAFNSLNQLVSRKLTHWTKKSYPLSNWAPADWHPRVVSEETQVFDTSGNGVSATMTYEYEGDLNQRETPVLMKKSSQYAFVVAGNPPPSVPVRTSETTFLINDPNIAQSTRDIYKAQNMIGLATASVVKDGAGTVVSRSEMKYDDGGYSPNIGRGNPTTARVWDSTKGSWDNPNAYLQTRAKFDVWGNQYESTDAKGISTTTTFDATYHAFPIKVTSAVPDPTNTHGSNTAFETTATFNTATGLPLTMTDANGLETRIEYDAATLRPLNKKTYYQNAQIGGMSETIYHDEPNNYWVKSRTQIDADKWAESITYFDGLGRAYKAEEVNSQGNIFVEKEFDQDGRVKRVTNPFRANETKIWTTNVYDESSRVKEVVLPDGAKVKTDYGVSTASGLIGITKTITDQAGKKRKGISDALGRMVRVIEDPDGQNLNTDYVFDTLGNLRKTIQGEQSRYFTYDSLGRLLYAKQPEQEANASFNLSDSITNNSNWAVKYQYDDNGNIVSTTDARGVTVTGTYDNLNRLIFRDYSDSTPNVDFYYDGRGLGNIPNFSKGKTTKVTSSVSENRYTSFDNFGRLLTSQQITDGQTYQSGFQFDAFGKLLSETYPSGRTVKFDYNQDGDVSSVWGTVGTQNRLYANAMSYNSSGAIERLRLGNGKWETTAYNNRLQVTEIGLGKTAQPIKVY